MKIIIGSKNPSKVDSVREVLGQHFPGATFDSIGAASGISDQPFGLKKTIRGAMTRAINAFTNCDYSVGLEAGMIEMPLTKTGYVNATVCSIYDGKEHHLGLGPGFELPEEVVRLMQADGVDIDTAIHRLGYSDDPRIGYSGGIIGVFTNGGMNRKEYTTPAVWMALAKLNHPK